MNLRRLLVKPRLPALRRDTRAATAVEYGLILALVVLTLITALVSVADVTTGIWSNVSTKVTRAS